MILPNPPAKGDSVLTWARNITDYLRSLRPSSGPGIRIQHTTTGMAISADPGRPTPTAPPLLFPWQAYPVPYEGEGTPPPDQWKKFKVNPGAVNNIIPSNYQTTFTAADQQKFGIIISISRNDFSVTITDITLMTGPAPTSIPKDNAGVPVQLYVLLGTTLLDDYRKTVRFLAHRSDAMALECVQISESCTDVSFALILS